MNAEPDLQQGRTESLLDNLENPVRIAGVVSRTKVEKHVTDAIRFYLSGKISRLLEHTLTARGRSMLAGGFRITGKYELSEEFLTFSLIKEDKYKKILLLIGDIDNARRINLVFKNRSISNKYLSKIGSIYVESLFLLNRNSSSVKDLENKFAKIISQFTEKLKQISVPICDLMPNYQSNAKNYDNIYKILKGSISLGITILTADDIQFISEKLKNKGIKQKDLPEKIKSELFARADRALRISKGKDSIMTTDGNVFTGQKSTFAIWRIKKDKITNQQIDILKLRLENGRFISSVIKLDKIKKRAGVVYETKDGKSIVPTKIKGHVRNEKMEDETFGVYKSEYLKNIINEFPNGATVVPFEIGFSSLNALLGYAEADKILLAMAKELLNNLGEKTNFKIIKAGTVLILVGPKDTSKNYVEKICTKTAIELLEGIKIIDNGERLRLNDFLLDERTKKIGSTGFFFEHAIAGTDEEGKLMVKEYVSKRREIPALAFKE